MNMTEQEMEEALASQMAYQAHLEGMMRDDGWTVNDYEKNQNIAAIELWRCTCLLRRASGR